ncbi:MAG TPA: class I SAM-dependent methyltransferase [Candidatus Solibacter sp.]|nr:class I SAM-dependent methyltransferase [Candidatus Solibacter sp.]
MSIPGGNEVVDAVSEQVLAMLRCLDCRAGLDRYADGLVCATCGQKYPAVNGVIRFVDQQHYAGSFGFQWQVHARTQLDTAESKRSEQAFRQRTGFCPEDLAGKFVLDVGCGMGRFADVACRWGARVVGIDLSLAAEVAARNLAGKEATIFQADVFRLPFAEHSFDFIYSIGVLHHTPDCERAFKMLPGLLKPGGRIAIWLYSKYNAWYRMSDIYRKVTRRMPSRMLYTLCYGVVPLYGIHQVLRKIPLVGRAASGALAYAIPMAFHPDRKWRILDTFDWYSPWYQSKHSYEEVFRWFESCGLEDLRVIEQPIAVQGRRPLLNVKPTATHQPDEVSQCAG